MKSTTQGVPGLASFGRVTLLACVCVFSCAGSGAGELTGAPGDGYDPIVQIPWSDGTPSLAPKRLVWNLTDLEYSLAEPDEARPQAIPMTLSARDGAAILWAKPNDVLVLGRSDPRGNAPAGVRNPWLREPAVPHEPRVDVLNVDGVVGLAQGSGAAVVNGHVVINGEVVGGWRLLGECPEGLVFERGASRVGLRGLGRFTIKGE